MSLTVVTWNMWTLGDTDNNTSRPERYTALIARECARYSINIAPSSKTRLAHEGSIKELGGGYTCLLEREISIGRQDLWQWFCYWKQLPEITERLICEQNEYLMSLQLPIGKLQFVTLSVLMLQPRTVWKTQRMVLF